MSDAIDSPIEPIQVRFSKAAALVGESRVTLYEAVRKGQLDLIKDDAGHSYLLYAQLKARCAARKIVRKPAEKPYLKAARDAYHARRKKQQAKTPKR